MPLYEYKCSCGRWFDKYLKLADCGLPVLCECGKQAEKQLSAPFVQTDIMPYQSPIDGRYVGGKRARREDLRRSGCVEWEPGVREEAAQRRARAEEALDRGLEQTLDAEISQMPARKRELLEQEVRAGADVIVTRGAPNA